MQRNSHKETLVFPLDHMKNLSLSCMANIFTTDFFLFQYLVILLMFRLLWELQNNYPHTMLGTS